jgi:hypothetical protein
MTITSSKKKESTMEKIKLNNPKYNPAFGWFVSGEIEYIYLNKDGNIYETTKGKVSERRFYPSPSKDPESGYWETCELAMEAKRKYEDSFIQPEPQPTAYELERPVQENDKWCVYAKDTRYQYALSKDITISHILCRGFWNTYTAALFAKLRYERKTKNLTK